jgi:hypothetical protein
MAGKKWTEESKRAWADKCRALRSKNKGGGVEAGVAGSGDHTGASSSGADDRDTGGGSGAEHHEGGYAGTSRSKRPLPKKDDERPVIDFPKIKDALPEILIEYNELLDDGVQAVTSNKTFKRQWYLKPLTLEKAKAESEFLAKLLESILPAFIQRHPVLSAIFVVVFRPLMRLRSKEKPKEEKTNAEAKAETKEIVSLPGLG